MFKRHCVKCKNEYFDAEDEDFYCAKCFEEKKIIAAEIDAKHQPSEKTMSDLEVFDSVAKTKTGTQVIDGIVVKRSQSFARAQDIMGE